MNKEQLKELIEKEGDSLQWSYTCSNGVIIECSILRNSLKALCGYIYFTQLRIKEQLGYTARAKIFSEGNVIYYMILVQGSKKTPEIMDLRIENVVEMMRKRIEDAPQKKFEKFKNIISSKIGKRDRSLKVRSFR